MPEGIPGMSERQIMTDDGMSRALSRIAHEILERNRGAGDLLLVGIHRRGVPLANRLSERLADFEGVTVPVGSLDINLYRDDLRERKSPKVRVRRTNLPVSIKGQSVILVDDVLYTGRTIRAALDALTDFGRPTQVQLAVMIDRGHRELPIRADYVGRNIPTARGEIVAVRLTENDGTDEVALLRPEETPGDEPEAGNGQGDSPELVAAPAGDGLGHGEAAMTEGQYRKLFKDMGIDVRGLRLVLRYAGQSRRVYFNRNSNVGIYFSAHADDETWYPGNLWVKIDSHRVQKADHGRLNVVPRSGMETRAFRNLVSNWQNRRVY